MKDKQKWLVYFIYSPVMCQHDTGWRYFSVASGDTDEEIYRDWVNNVKLIYGVDYSDKIKYDEHLKKWFCNYEELYKCKLPDYVIGHANPISINCTYQDWWDQDIAKQYNFK